MAAWLCQKKPPEACCRFAEWHKGLPKVAAWKAALPNTLITSVGGDAGFAGKAAKPLQKVPPEVGVPVFEVKTARLCKSCPPESGVAGYAGMTRKGLC
jgi:hypothetical protein